MLHHLKYMKTPRFEHYEIEYDDPANSFAFLGNGFVASEFQVKGEDIPVPYIRKREEDPWEIV